MNANLLIVDDNPNNLRLLTNILRNEGYLVRPAINGQTALIAAKEHIPDLVLLDINMPEMDGYQVLQAFKQHERLAQVPVILISALDDLNSKMKAFEYGGIDYISKPFQYREVVARVRAQLTLYFQKREIERLNHRYQDLFDNANDLIQSVNGDGNYLFVNRYWCKVLEYSEEEALQMNMIQVIHPDYLEKCQSIFRDLATTSSSRDHVEAVFVSRSGKEIIVEGNVNCEYDSELGFHTRGIFRDLTERRHAQKHTINLLIDRERINIMTNFVQNTSHDLRTPLSIIKQQTYLIQRIEDPQSRAERLNLIDGQVKKLNDALTQLHELIQLEHESDVQFASVALPTIVDVVFERTRQAIHDKSLHVSLIHDQEDLNIHGNLEMLQVAFQQLLDNAIMYTPEDGTITIHTGKQGNECAFIEVSDSGPGIEAMHLPYIFDPMYKVNSARTQDGSGSGLGLSIARRIMNLHNGEVEVETTPGQGSYFRLILP